MKRTKTKCQMCGALTYLSKMGFLLIPSKLKGDRISIAFCLKDDSCFEDAFAFVNENTQFWDRD